MCFALFIFSFLLRGPFSTCSISSIETTVLRGLFFRTLLLSGAPPPPTEPHPLSKDDSYTSVPLKLSPSLPPR
ncbi:uncharacterized protein BDR25DRAFT_128888 [Lindgomyces ingoldianus]|uniref:Uncharacterized protein n=1 Tax=Lindgomyces ingoldianus TaxID=673940 RepID=A0ACB6R1J6_9PLEO|nr:uncharacterized protein BDR25DRAFT_128888 [Lindgomyces ingoldianus]KAF2473128.1 hypothetical protein BDR25DRAFT_128888 [Lindgomyces ingoldianus]